MKNINNELRECKKCNVTKNMVKGFYKQYRYENAYKNTCKECFKKDVKRYDKKNPAAHKERTTKYSKANPGKIHFNTLTCKLRKKNSTSVIDSSTKEYDKLRSVYIKSAAMTSEGETNYQVHHILPISQGGQHCFSNVVILSTVEH